MSAPERLTCPVCERDLSALGVMPHLANVHGVGSPVARERWPELVHAAYDACRWRKAERRNNADRIECRICGLHAHVLGRHLPAAHGIDSEEYLRRYPGAPLASEHHRAVAADNRLDRLGPPYWTPERIIAAIQRWAKRTGEPPAAKQWERGTSSRTRPSTRRVLDVFGSWNVAIRAAGFDPRLSGGVSGRLWTKCRAGLHDLTDPDNLYTDASGKRCCRPCNLAYQRTRRAARKAASDDLAA